MKTGTDTLREEFKENCFNKMESIGNNELEVFKFNVNGF